MTNFFRITALAAAVLAGVACNLENKEVVPGQDYSVITVSLPSDISKTTLGESVADKRSVYWADGDQLSCNGTASVALSGVPAESQSASFTFPGVLSTPYNLLYPASFYKNASTITLPATQTYAAGSFATGTEPLAGYTESESDPVTLNHLCSIVQLRIKKDAGVSLGTIEKITFKGNSGEQVTGDFTINYAAGTLTSASSADADKVLEYTLSQPLSESTALDAFLVVPARIYSSGFTVIIEDDAHRTMTKTKSSSANLAAGKLSRMTEFTFVPGSIATEFTIDDVIQEVIPLDGYNITGRVVDNLGNPLENVVVSDGIQSVKTMLDGSFYMTSTVANVSFVFVSSPSGYMPPVVNGIPRFYKAKADVTPTDGIYDFGDYVMTPVANPDTFTLFITADPQPRATDTSLDNVAYRSTRACEALYQDLTETAADISGRQVYGICLGDLVHENMDLMDTYATALGTLGYPTYNIIGNHDYDTTQADDDAGAWKFESLFGPRNYSFNIGGIHFVVLDNLIMKDNGQGSLSAYDQGLTDDIWTWLQGDMAFIPTTTTVMVCAHSPMFKQETGSERTNSAKHGGHTSSVDGPAFGYGDLFDTYDEVHAWAGHTHSTFNFIYSGSHRHKTIQVHTLARSTGELWTNEYLANGTPRGFTIVEVKNGSIDSWRFHPTKYLKSSFHGTHGQPSYDYCDWVYSGSSPLVAKMKDTNADLDESYQMHVYTPSAYGDNKIYANVFLWDSLWNVPTISINGGAAVNMIQVEDVNTSPENRTGYDKANDEIMSFYYANYSLLRSAGYENSPRGVPLTMFRAPSEAPASGTATVSVTDRFGSVYTRTISW